MLVDSTLGALLLVTMLRFAFVVDRNMHRLCGCGCTGLSTLAVEWRRVQEGEIATMKRATNRTTKGV